MSELHRDVGLTDDGTQEPLHSPSASTSATASAGVNVTNDGGVVKHVISEGSGDVPPLHARCLGAYTKSDLGS